MNNSSYNNYKFPVVEKVIKKEVLKTKLPNPFTLESAIASYIS